MRSLFRSGGATAPVVLALVTALVAPRAALADGGPTLARVSVVNGTVAIGHGDATAPASAAVNAPVRAGDYVTTGAQSRGEVQFDETTVVRLGENVQLRVAHLDGANHQLQLAAGTIDYRLLRGTDGANAVDTPSISVVPRTAGTYRITVETDGTTVVTVRAGSADITTPRGTQPLQPGTTLVASGAAANPHVTMRDAIAYDAFDAFNQDRDRSAQPAPAYSVAAGAQSPSDPAPPARTGSWVIGPSGWIFVAAVAIAALAVARPSYAYAHPPTYTTAVVRLPSYAVPQSHFYASWSGRYPAYGYGPWRNRGVYR